ncbi:hypothetical protein [Nitrincola alkalisediminis]|uniref:hypothetical protein n=1 Tax=Nitrincola alkalisediminis TaxID=1366656 RepID=UPI001873E683|nr:hypothetical protein [Nitrincola alkalisediminis]
MTKPIDQHRINFGGKEDPKGRLFVCPKTAAITDLKNVRVLHTGVDTVRQLYRGKLVPGLVDKLAESNGHVSMFGTVWFAGRVGRDSGYQYKLQNLDLGLILLVKNFNAKPEHFGPHLKIEVSPHLIQSRTPEDLQKLLDSYAHQVLDECTHNQCAIHIAVDIQGYNLPSDLVARMHCKARAQRDISGVQRIEFDGKFAVYGRGETFMWGAPSGIQLSMYNKTAQAKAIDKLDYWESIWRSHDNPFDDKDPLNYDPSMPVLRIELRYHHSVIEQFAQGSVNVTSGAVIDTHTYADLVPHLTAIWRYGLSNFKLLDTPSTYNALWTFLRQDIIVSIPPDLTPDDVEYKRHYKTASGFSGKNVELFLGNMISLLAREGVGAKKAFNSLQRWECWTVIKDHFEQKGKTERDIYDWIRDKLTERTIRWGVAV